MGTIVADLFVTLDGVYQAPGGPNEDHSGGFEFGGWQAPFFDDESGEALDAGFADFDALLLGRKTYDIFADYWPKHTADPIGRSSTRCRSSSSRTRHSIRRGRARPC